jgi:hypothetical protein
VPFSFRTAPHQVSRTTTATARRARLAVSQRGRDLLDTRRTAAIRAATAESTACSFFSRILRWMRRADPP